MASSNNLQAQISTRLSIRWLPEPPFETTDTIVLTINEWYVDLRINKDTGLIDWAIAGQCLQQPGSPRRLVFTHTIDSNNNFNISDPCPFIPLPNGNDLETGAMPRPDIPGTPITKYEEVWRYHPVQNYPEPSSAWILESVDNKLRGSKTFLGRIGGVYLALHQEQVHADSSASAAVKGGPVSARREEWTGTQWEEKYVLGPSGKVLPSMQIGIDGIMQKSWNSLGQKVSVGECQYIVRAFENLDSRGSSGKPRL